MSNDHLADDSDPRLPGGGGDQEMLDAIAAAFGTDAINLIESEAVEIDPTDPESLTRAAAQLEGKPAASNTDNLESLVREIDEAVLQRSGGSPHAETSPQAASILEKVVLVELGDSVFGIPMANVHEIQRVPAITRLPNVPAWVLGVANLRGNILSVVDLRLLLGMAPFDTAPGKQRLVVTQSLVDDLDAGFIVDRVIGVRSISQQRIARPTAPVSDKISPYLSGIVEVDEALLALLDADKLMLSEDFRQFEPT